MNSYNIDLATKIIISTLQDKLKKGFDLDISNHHDWTFSLNKIIEKFKTQNNLLKNIDEEIFADSCWFLALQGLIRPSTITPHGTTGGTHGANGMYFSITQSGKEWLKSHTGEYFIFVNAEQYKAIVEPFSSHFGEVFIVRSREAGSCYQSCNYYATCAMAGAATESIILSIGTKILGSIEEVKKTYNKAGGRNKLSNKIKSGLSKDLQDGINHNVEMLNYWRDESAHGSCNNITKFEASNSLEKLLNFSRLIHTKWDSLVQTK
jgi:hypothetical protein